MAQVDPHIGVAVGDVLSHFGAEIIKNMLKQSIKQIFFIFEMPIQCAAGNAGGLGDFIE